DWPCAPGHRPRPKRHQRAIAREMRDLGQQSSTCGASSIGSRLVGSDLGEGGGVVAQAENEIVQGIGSDYLTKYGFANPDEAEAYFFKSGRGLSHELVEAISEHKNEPDWMRKFRHQSLDYFLARPLPSWGGDVS